MTVSPTARWCGDLVAGMLEGGADASAGDGFEPVPPEEATAAEQVTVGQPRAEPDVSA